MILPGDISDEAHFVFNGYQHLLTEAERLAWKNLQVGFKQHHAGNDATTRMLSTWLHHSPEVDALLAGGPEDFYRRVVHRLYVECRADLNLCPKCGALCRTPKACLCPACNHTWYHTRAEANDSSGVQPPP
jgi:hypothetical protein